MGQQFDPATKLLDPSSLPGALFVGVLVFMVASIAAALIRRGARRIEAHLSDVTALGFVSALAQTLTYLFGFVLYAHLIPELRAVGTALLAGVSVVSVIVGIAAQSTLGNIVAGFSLVLSGTVRVGDAIHLASPVGAISARVKLISLAHTVLLDAESREVVVPNSVIMGSAITRLMPPSG